METTEPSRAARISASVSRVRARLVRGQVVAIVRERAWIALTAGAILAASRAFIWPSALEDAPLAGLPRAAAIFAFAASASLAIIALASRLRLRLSKIEVARRIDEHLELAEVVASALAFASYPERSVPEDAAVERGARALEGFDPVRAFPRQRWRPSPRRTLAAVAIAMSALVLGTLDSRVLTVLLEPPTRDEVEAAQALERAADELERAEARAEEERRARAGSDGERSESERSSHEASESQHGARTAARAREVAQRTRGGDRQAAMRALRGLSRRHRERAAHARRRSRQLAAMGRSLGARPPQPQRGERSGERADSNSVAASERARLLARRLEERAQNPSAPRDRGAERRMLDRLQRSAQRAARMGLENQRLERALERAAQAIAEGREADAAEPLQVSAQELARLERALEEGRVALAREGRVAEAAGRLERALQRQRLGREGESDAGAGEAREGLARAGSESGGREGSEGSGAGRQLSSAIANRLAALGLARAPSAGTLDQGSNPRRGRALDALPAHGESHARSQVSGSGGQAIAAVRGLGADGTPTTEYRDVYPTYGVQVEEALADERIPASRRRVVRRYFESIRPGAGNTAAENTEE